MAQNSFPYPKPVIIIVSGLPGCGKTYFATRLAEAVRAQYVGSDLVRNDLEDRGVYVFDDTLVVYEEMARRVSNWARTGHSSVVDATFFKKRMRDLFRTLALLLRLPLVHVHITADELTVRERFRLKTKGSRADFSVYRLVKDQYDTLEDEHLKIASDKVDIKSMLDQAVQYVSGVVAKVLPAK